MSVAWRNTHGVGASLSMMKLQWNYSSMRYSSVLILLQSKISSRIKLPPEDHVYGFQVKKDPEGADKRKL